jgi:hypothetical protein
MRCEHANPQAFPWQWGMPLWSGGERLEGLKRDETSAGVYNQGSAPVLCRTWLRQPRDLIRGAALTGWVQPKLSCIE